ncbi:MAG: FAD-dependent oxidoreductase [Planctomycetes bacterium]|nr:FAD-dependent oxidoreductase [Planctomycetota bacterium]
MLDRPPRQVSADRPRRRHKMSGQTLVLGGGLAGMAAAVRLAQAGHAVTLIETSRRLGGRATSHIDPASGQQVDNCQHVLLGCCTNLLDLYRRLGVGDEVDWHDDLHFFDKQGHHDVLLASDLPAPLHLSESMMRFGTLTLAQKLAVGRAMLAMMLMSRDQRESLHHLTFSDWLRRHGQTEAVIERFWAVIVVSALNQMPETCGAPFAIQVFQEGFLAHRDAYRMGTAAVPLAQLYDPATRVIEDAGGKVMFGASAKRIVMQGDRIGAVELVDGQTIDIDDCISALPFDRLDKVAGDDLKQRDRRLDGLKHFKHSPILGIHLWFDRQVVPYPHMIFVDSPLQWIFNKGGVGSGECGVKAGERSLPFTPHSALPTPQYLHGVISAADAWIDLSAEAIIDMALRELSAYVSGDLRAALANAKVIKEKRATFSPTPGIEAHRPATCGDVANLFLAGDWTRTGWPATMEGAARSGYMAAAAVMGEAPVPAVADLTPAPLYKCIARVGRVMPRSSVASL